MMTSSVHMQMMITEMFNLWQRFVSRPRADIPLGNISSIIRDCQNIAFVYVVLLHKIGDVFIVLLQDVGVRLKRNVETNVKKKLVSAFVRRRSTNPQGTRTLWISTIVSGLLMHPSTSTCYQLRKRFKIKNSTSESWSPSRTPVKRQPTSKLSETTALAKRILSTFPLAKVTFISIPSVTHSSLISLSSVSPLVDLLVLLGWIK